jgi:hypothetical protein
MAPYKASTPAQEAEALEHRTVTAAPSTSDSDQKQGKWDGYDVVDVACGVIY